MLLSPSLLKPSCPNLGQWEPSQLNSVHCSPISSVENTRDIKFTIFIVFTTQLRDISTFTHAALPHHPGAFPTL